MARYYHRTRPLNIITKRAANRYLSLSYSALLSGAFLFSPRYLQIQLYMCRAETPTMSAESCECVILFNFFCNYHIVSQRADTHSIFVQCSSRESLMPASASGGVLMCMRAARLLLTIFIYLLLCAPRACYFSSSSLSGRTRRRRCKMRQIIVIMIYAPLCPSASGSFDFWGL
jgi:hypothetical protein